jgi:thymidylate synthase
VKNFRGKRSSLFATDNSVIFISGLKAGEFIHTLGDAHVYNNHFEALKVQLQREPFPFPTIEFKRKVDTIEDFGMDDFEIKNYVSHPAVSMVMAV